MFNQKFMHKVSLILSCAKTKETLCKQQHFPPLCYVVTELSSTVCHAKVLTFANSSVPCYIWCDFLLLPASFVASLNNLCSEIGEIVYTNSDSLTVFLFKNMEMFCGDRFGPYTCIASDRDLRTKTNNIIRKSLYCF